MREQRAQEGKVRPCIRHEDPTYMLSFGAPQRRLDHRRGALCEPSCRQHTVEILQSGVRSPTYQLNYTVKLWVLIRSCSFSHLHGKFLLHYGLCLFGKAEAVFSESQRNKHTFVLKRLGGWGRGMQPKTVTCFVWFLWTF